MPASSSGEERFKDGIRRPSQRAQGLVVLRRRPGRRREHARREEELVPRPRRASDVREGARERGTTRRGAKRRRDAVRRRRPKRVGLWPRGRTRGGGAAVRGGPGRARGEARGLSSADDAGARRRGTGEGRIEPVPRRWGGVQRASTSGWGKPRSARGRDRAKLASGLGDHRGRGRGPRAGAASAGVRARRRGGPGGRHGFCLVLAVVVVGNEAHRRGPCISPRKK